MEYLYRYFINKELKTIKVNTLEYWKNWIFLLLSVSSLIFMAPLMFYGAYIYFVSKLFVEGLIEFSLGVLIIFIVLKNSLSVDIRKNFVLYILYILCIMLIITAGNKGAGMVGIVFSLILTACLCNKKEIIVFAGINIVTFVILTIFLFNGVFDTKEIYLLKKTWLLVSITTQVSALILMTVIYTILNELDKLSRISKLNEEHLSLILESMTDGVVAVDSELKVVLLNNIAEKLLYNSKNKKDLYVYNVFNIYSENDLRKIKFDNNFLIGQLNSKYSTYLLEQDYNKKIYIELNVSEVIDEENTNTRYVIVFKDISERRAKELEIEFLGTHDVLTGLLNRTYFERNLNIYNNTKLPISVIIGDLNGLKLINDVYGHLFGDELLLKSACILQEIIKDKGDIIRWGGDEFIIIMPNTDESEAVFICSEIKRICESTNIDQLGFEHISISLGYDTKTNIDDSIVKTLRNAEDFMYRKKLLESKSLHSNILNYLKNTLNEKSKETSEHADRLIYFSKILADELDLKEDDLNKLELFAMLHDIGKIAISDSILLKPGRLNDAEREEIKKHSEIGYRIALSSPELASISELILTHHERWDGDGYPQGLAGERIPLLSRILSIADAYDAMTEDRPYRKKMSKESAIIELQNNSGTQFDPIFTELFINLISNNDEKKEEG